MGKILGEVFDKYVDEQIQTRQKSLAKRQKSPDDLVVFNSSTPWIRLSSSILVGPDRAETLAKNLGISKDQVAGNALAKNLVLFAGTSDGANLSDRKGGVGYGLKNSYGFLSGKEQGYKPMPGISSISAKYIKNGTLKQAQVNLTCFTREQFEAIEAIYLRLGFTMLLEWGHSIYFDNSGKKQNMSALKIPNILFREKLPDPNEEGQKAVEKALKKNPKLTSSERDAIYFEVEQKVRKDNPDLKNKKDYPTRLRKEIQNNKKSTAGNYDAIVSKVQNFSWNLNSDLSYSITLDLISVGDIVDSLKMNFGGTSISEVNTSQIQLDAGVQNLAAIELASGASAFNSFLSELTQGLQTDNAKEELDTASQQKLVVKDEVKEALELVPEIGKTYSGVLKELRKVILGNYQEVQNLLIGKKVSNQYSTTFSLFALMDTKVYADKLVPLLKTISSSSLGKADKNFDFRNGVGTSNPEDISRLTTERTKFYATFDLEVQLSGSATRGLGDRQQSGILQKAAAGESGRTNNPEANKIRNLKDQFEILSKQVTDIVVIGSVEDVDNLNNANLYKYLGDNISTAKDVVVRGLLTGFYDKGKKVPSKIQVDNYFFGTTFIEDLLKDLSSK